MAPNFTKRCSSNAVASIAGTGWRWPAGGGEGAGSAPRTGIVAIESKSPSGNRKGLVLFAWEYRDLGMSLISTVDSDDDITQGRDGIANAWEKSIPNLETSWVAGETPPSAEPGEIPRRANLPAGNKRSELPK